jgi:lysylphosphatidylglycerol synthetase-like protein (DUF2156 family)
MVPLADPSFRNDSDVTPQAVEHVSIAELKAEFDAAAKAAASQLRNILATARIEAQLSVAAAMRVATARSLSVAFALIAWTSLVAAIIWFVVSLGAAPAIALLVSAIVHFAIALASFHWHSQLMADIGFRRTGRLWRELRDTGRTSEGKQQ